MARTWRPAWRAGRPGADAERAALSRAVAAKLGGKLAPPARIWLIKLLKDVGRVLDFPVGDINDICKKVEELGFDCMLGEGADRLLDWRSPQVPYRPLGCERLKLLLKNKLSLT